VKAVSVLAEEGQLLGVELVAQKRWTQVVEQRRSERYGDCERVRSTYCRGGQTEEARLGQRGTAI
jgi:hypothetical protein